MVILKASLGLLAEASVLTVFSFFWAKAAIL
jgi:hypothetical protein